MIVSLRKELANCLNIIQSEYPEDQWEDYGVGRIYKLLEATKASSYCMCCGKESYELSERGWCVECENIEAVGLAFVRDKLSEEVSNLNTMLTDKVYYI